MNAISMYFVRLLCSDGLKQVDRGDRHEPPRDAPSIERLDISSESEGTTN